MKKSIFGAAILLVAAVAGGATGALITNYSIKASPELTDRVLLIDPADPTNTKSATLGSLGLLLVDWAAPGVIGATTPNAATFTTLTADGFDFGDPSSGETGEIGLPEDPDNGTNTITLKAAADMATDLIFTLPNAYAVAEGHALVGNGSGILSFAQVLVPSNIGTTVQAYDADLTDLSDGSLTGSKVGSGVSAANITTGTLPDARLSTLVPKWVSSVPTAATDTCTAGTAAYDSGYIYVCVATNTWARTALAIW